MTSWWCNNDSFKGIFQSLSMFLSIKNDASDSQESRRTGTTILIFLMCHAIVAGTIFSGSRVLINFGPCQFSHPITTRLPYFHINIFLCKWFIVIWYYADNSLEYRMGSPIIYLPLFLQSHLVGHSSILDANLKINLWLLCGCHYDFPLQTSMHGKTKRTSTWESLKLVVLLVFTVTVPSKKISQ